VTAAFDVLHGSQCRFIAAHQLHVIDVDIQLSTTSHSPLGLGLSNGRESQSSFWNDQHPIHGDIIQSLKIHRIAHVRIGGRDGSIQSQPYGRLLFEHESSL